MNEVDDLISSLNEEFGVKKRKRARAPRERAAPNIQELSHKSFKNVADYRMAQLMQESNSISRLPEFSSAWVAEARETWITTQHCNCCGESTQFIAGEYVRWRNKRQHAVFSRRLEACTNEWHFHPELPEQLVEQEQDVERCPRCIMLGRTVERLWDTALVQNGERAPEQVLEEIELDLNDLK